jgi:hypothetical protein
MMRNRGMPSCGRRDGGVDSVGSSTMVASSRTGTHQLWSFGGERDASSLLDRRSRLIVPTITSDMDRPGWPCRSGRHNCSTDASITVAVWPPILALGTANSALGLADSILSAMAMHRLWSSSGPFSIALFDCRISKRSSSRPTGPSWNE